MQIENSNEWTDFILNSCITSWLLLGPMRFAIYVKENKREGSDIANKTMHCVLMVKLCGLGKCYWPHCHNSSHCILTPFKFGLFISQTFLIWAICPSQYSFPISVFWNSIFKDLDLMPALLCGLFWHIQGLAYLSEKGVAMFQSNSRYRCRLPAGFDLQAVVNP